MMMRLLLGTLLAGAMVSASAAEGITLGGMETDGANSYLYAGILAPVGPGPMGNGLVQRYWIDHVEYRYASAGQTVKAEGWGAEAALGFQGAERDRWWGTYLGAVCRDTRLSPDDPNSRARGESVRLKVQAEMQAPIAANWSANGNLSYILGQKAYWARLRLLTPFGNGMHIGPELLLQGDPNYNARQFGLVLANLRLAQSIDTAIKMGVRHTSGEAARAYFGIEFGRAF
ncbi:cellulose biosynthesis protein BcsS [Sulfuriferula multivorans]|nr:cellulose biosynthesis protein BcsS [Sulfuriferula multivorans]